MADEGLSFEQAQEGIDFEDAKPRGAGEAFLRSAATGVAPSAAAAAAFGPGFEAGTVLGAETGPFAPLVGLGVGAVTSGLAAWGASRAQRALVPDFIKAQEQAARQNPKSAMAGNIVAQIPAFRLQPLQTIRGLTDIAAGRFGSEAAKGAVAQLGTQGALTAAQSLVQEHRLPNRQELTQAGVNALLFGGPRGYLGGSRAPVPPSAEPLTAEPVTEPLQLPEVSQSTRAEQFRMPEPGMANARAQIPEFAESRIPFQMPDKPAEAVQEAAKTTEEPTEGGTPQQDYTPEDKAEHARLGKEIQRLTKEKKWDEIPAVWQQFENVRNKYGGAAPKAEAAPEAPVETPSEAPKPAEAPAETPVEPPKPAEEGPAPEGLTFQSGLFGVRIPNFKRTVEDLKKLREFIPGFVKQTIGSVPMRHFMDQTFDAADNLANIVGKQSGKHVSLGSNDLEQRAASAVVASGFNRAELPNLLAKAQQGKNPEAIEAVNYAMNNWAKVEPVAQRGADVFSRQLTDENSHGISTLSRENYLPGVYDNDLWMGNGRPYVIQGTAGGGAASGFKKGKSFATPFDAIAEGYKPKSLNLSELVEHRVRQGQRLINRLEWGNALKGQADPVSGKPIVDKLQTVSRGPGQPSYTKAPLGYTPKEIIPGVVVAVHEGYSKLFDALTGTSALSTFEPGGIPVGQLALKAAGGIKHGLLLFDTFHASRVAQRELFLTGKVSYKKGTTLLDYSDADLDRALKENEITPEMADYARENRPKAQKILDAGLNVGRVSEAMDRDIIKNMPIVGAVNKWVFDKLSRGAMLEASLIEFDRLKQSTGLSDKEVYLKVARDMNKYFGSLGRQGIFKSRTLQDMSRLMFLAPNWVESMIRTEAGAAKDMTVAGRNALMTGQLNIGSLGKGVGQGLLAYFLGTQILNLATRGQFTWDNPEHGHQLDAWIPDVSGKTKGFFLSPFGVVAEMTQDMRRYIHQEPSISAAVSRIVSNKLSPLMRAEEVFRTGKDWDQSQLVGDWDRAKAAGLSLVPSPIPASPLLRGGQLGGLRAALQRQVTASLGVKTEPAGTSNSQVVELARNWMSKSEDPKVRQAWENRVVAGFKSPYRGLRIALLRGTDDDVINEYRKVLSARGPDESAATRGAEISKALRTRHAFTNTQANDRKFLNTLTPDQRKLYDAALKERDDSIKRYYALRPQLKEAP